MWKSCGKNTDKKTEQTVSHETNSLDRNLENLYMEFYVTKISTVIQPQ